MTRAILGEEAWREHMKHAHGAKGVPVGVVGDSLGHGGAGE